MSTDTDYDVFISKVFQLRDELSDLSEIFSNESLTTIILDALPGERYSTIEVQLIRDLFFRNTGGKNKL